MECTEREIKEYGHLKLAIDASMTGFFDLNISRGGVYYSLGWKRITGYDEFPDNVGDLDKLLDDAGLQLCLKMRDQAILKTRNRFSFDIRIKHRNGHWVDVLVKAETAYDEKGENCRLIGTYTDISVQKDAERKLKQKTVELEKLLVKSEKQRLAHLAILSDLNITSTKLKNEIAEHKKAKNELDNSHVQLKRLLHHLQNAREEQNAYIAREIHDDLGQELTALEILLTLFGEKLAESEVSDETLFSLENELRIQLDSVVEKTRKLTMDLRPAILDTYNLVEALVWLGGQFERKTGLSVNTDVGTGKIDLGSARNLAVFRICQEALNNAVKHSGAENLKISITDKNDNLIIRIEDDGCGFRNESPDPVVTFGLMNMHERAQFCEGELKIESEEGKGTSIVVRIPVKAES